MTGDAERLRAMPRLLDARGLICPEPVLRTSKVIREVPPGETLTVLATDPAATIDFRYYCHHAGLELLSVKKEMDVLTFEIRKPIQSAPIPCGSPPLPGSRDRSTP